MSAQVNPGKRRAQPASPSPQGGLAPPAEATSEPSPGHEQIAGRAFELREARGRVDGADQEDWYEAERPLRDGLAPPTGTTPPGAIMVPEANRPEPAQPPGGIRAPKREQSRGEEIANSISHGLGLVAALVATPILVSQALRRGDAGFIVGVSVFATTMVLLYLASTLYHSLPSGRAKQVFRVIEHSAIFLLLAGTYTPFTLGALRGVRGWTLLGLVWGLASAGVALKVSRRMPHPVVTSTIYVMMGWLIVVAIDPLLDRVPASGLLWLFAGGVAYTAGVAFFAAGSRLRYGHFIWHLFVMAGTACHYLAVLWYAA